MDSIKDNHDKFYEWAIEHGIKINRVEAKIIPNKGLGLVTTSNLKQNEIIIDIPRKCIIKPEESIFKNVKNASVQAKLATMLYMNSSLYANDNSVDDDRRLNESPIAECESVWPSEDSFHSTLLWHNLLSDKCPDWFEYMPASLQKDAMKMRQDYAMDRAVLHQVASISELDHTPHDKCGILHIWAIANTRSFSWKASNSSRGMMVLCPFLDYMNHCPSGQGCNIVVDNNGFRLIANQDYDKGEEITASYGAHSNDRLLLDYGFILDDNSDDVISLDEVILPYLNAATKGLLQDAGYLGNYALTPNSNEICFRTQVALRSKLFNSTEVDYFITNGEDLTDDRSDQVEKLLCSFLVDFLPTIDRNIAALMKVQTEMNGKSAIPDVITRWYQIKQAFVDIVKKNGIEVMQD